MLLLARPGRVWLSTAGGPFEQVGPLAVPLAVPPPEGWDEHLGVVLPDGFLVVTYADGEGMRLQTSPDGRTWTAAPELPHYATSSPEALAVADERIVGIRLGRAERVAISGGNGGSCVDCRLCALMAAQGRKAAAEATRRLSHRGGPLGRVAPQDGKLWAGEG